MFFLMFVLLILNLLGVISIPAVGWVWIIGLSICYLIYMFSQESFREAFKAGAEISRKNKEK